MSEPCYDAPLRVEPGAKVKLKDLDPDAAPGVADKEAAKARLEAASKRLAHLQTVLYAQREHALLVVLQGMDAAGKDGAIRGAFNAFNPQGVIVTSFKEPTPVERRHDFLWRVHMRAPELGSIAIFNRSHYEDFLVNRAHGDLDDKDAALRLEQIVDFERLLAQNAVRIVKFFLHISKEEQLARFGKRLTDPERNWKIAESDYAERLYWADYQRAYEEALAATSRPEAPWHVIPANRKWFRDLAIAEIAVAALEGLKMAYPKPAVDLEDIRRKYHSAAVEEANERRS
ncbi:PPK2 family polyphosphate kinase [Methylocella sp.]|uniref:PPK2 family polyphosphate kinase n=1 Tax=Methylocella sp. TaxID=1978226 RepID=UPI0035B1C00A